jgi:hypothetical protein
MDPISIDDDEKESSSDGMEFDKASLLAPIVEDDTRIGQSGQEQRTPSDSRITYDISSDVSSDDEAVDSAQRMDIDAPHTTILGTPRERETDPTIDDPTTSNSAIIADPSKIDQPTPAPTRFSARLAEKRGRTIDDRGDETRVFTTDEAEQLFDRKTAVRP